MSNNVYSFHTRKQRELNPSLTQPAEKSAKRNTLDDVNSDGKITPQQTKSIILQSYDHFTTLKTSNPKIKYFSETMETISKEIVDTVGQLQGSSGKEQTVALSAKLEHLNQLHNQLKEEYTTLLKVELSVLYENWPPLFDKFIEGVDKETLEHVLTVFDDQVRGRYDANTAVGHGLDYMKRNYNLPKDFFNKNAIGEFVEGLNKPQPQ